MPRRTIQRTERPRCTAVVTTGRVRVPALPPPPREPWRMGIPHRHRILVRDPPASPSWSGAARPARPFSGAKTSNQSPGNFGNHSACCAGEPAAAEPPRKIQRGGEGGLRGATAAPQSSAMAQRLQYPNPGRSGLRESPCQQPKLRETRQTSIKRKPGFSSRGERRRVDRESSRNACPCAKCFCSSEKSSPVAMAAVSDGFQ